MAISPTSAVRRETAGPRRSRGSCWTLRPITRSPSRSRRAGVQPAVAWPRHLRCATSDPSLVSSIERDRKPSIVGRYGVRADEYVLAALRLPAGLRAARRLPPRISLEGCPPDPRSDAGRRHALW